MVERIRHFHMLNNQIFAILTNFTAVDEYEEDRAVIEFQPPVHPSLTGGRHFSDDT